MRGCQIEAQVGPLNVKTVSMDALSAKLKEMISPHLSMWREVGSAFAKSVKAFSEFENAVSSVHAPISGFDLALERDRSVGTGL